MRLIAFLQAWDLLRDELGRRPTIADYARRYALSAQAAHGDLACFDAAFPGLGPDEVLDCLWRWRDARIPTDGVNVRGGVKTPAGVPIPRG